MSTPAENLASMQFQAPPPEPETAPYAKHIVDEHEIPPELRTLPVWVAWKLTQKSGKAKPDKLPVSPITGRSDGWGNNPAFAGTFEQANAFAHRQRLHGLGVLLSAGCGIGGIDIDHCRNAQTGELSDLALEIMGSADTYFEVSPGLSGIRGFFFGSFGGHTGNDHTRGIELYESGRFLTVTGNHLEDSPFAIEARDLTELGRRYFPSSTKKSADKPQAEAPSDFEHIDLDALGLSPFTLHVIRSGDASRYSNDRSKALYAVAKDLVKAGISDTDIARILCDPANGISDKALSERRGDIASAMEWTIKYTIAKAREAVTADAARAEQPPPPRPLPTRGDMGEAPDFPTDRLPKALQAAAREVARFVKVPVASPVMVGLGALATAIGKRAVVVERKGHSHYPALFFVGIAGSGERKSPVFRHMAEGLEAWSMDQEEPWIEEVRRAKARNASVDNEISKAKRAKDKTREQVEKDIAALEMERLPVPPRPKLYSTDATEERIFQMLHERDGAFAVMSGEGRPVLDSIMGKYSGKDRTGDAIYLAGISGDTISRDRVGNAETGPEDRIIRRPCLNVCVLVQPDKYLEVAGHPALRASGALARIWPIWLPSMAGKQHEQPGEEGLSEILMRPFHNLVGAILKYPIQKDERGNPVPHIAHLSEEAKEARRVFHNTIQDMMLEGELSDCRDIAAKATSQTCKLALVLHLAHCPDVLAEAHSEIGAATWATAQMLGTYFLTEAVRAQRTAGDDPSMEAARRVLAWLARNARDSLSTTILMQEGPRPRPKKATEAEAVLDILEAYGWITAVNGGKARKPVYAPHPDLFSHFSRFSQGVG